jgi:hypothetical protein
MVDCCLKPRPAKLPKITGFSLISKRYFTPGFQRFLHYVFTRLPGFNEAKIHQTLTGAKR